MRIVGVNAGPGGVQVAALSDDATKVTVIAPLAEFWSDAAGYLTLRAGRPDPRRRGGAAWSRRSSRTPG